MNEQLNLIKEIVDCEVRPILQKDGGDIEIIDFKNKTLIVRVLGKCASCPNAQTEVTFLTENALKQAFDSDIKVELEITIDPDLNELAKKILRKEIVFSKN